MWWCIVWKKTELNLSLKIFILLFFFEYLESWWRKWYIVVLLFVLFYFRYFSRCGRIIQTALKYIIIYIISYIIICKRTIWEQIYISLTKVFKVLFMFYFAVQSWNFSHLTAYTAVCSLLQRFPRTIIICNWM